MTSGFSTYVHGPAVFTYGLGILAGLDALYLAVWLDLTFFACLAVLFFSVSAANAINIMRFERRYTFH